MDRLKLAAHLDAAVINKHSKDDLSNRRMYWAKVEDSAVSGSEKLNIDEERLNLIYLRRYNSFTTTCYLSQSKCISDLLET